MVEVLIRLYTLTRSVLKPFSRAQMSCPFSATISAFPTVPNHTPGLSEAIKAKRPA